MSDWLSETVRWYLVLVVVTWALAPVTRWVGGRLPDRGASIARPLALLVVIWPSWWLASVSPVPWAVPGLIVTVIALGIGGWYLAWRSKWIDRDWLKTLLMVEAISAVAFFSYAALRGYTPQIYWTEKPMDIAFLSSSARATDMPPNDPWFSSQPINYYYLGYLIYGTISRVAQLPTWIGFNLALASTASMAVVAAGGTAYNLARRWLGRRVAVGAGILGGFFVLIAGNMVAIKALIASTSAWHDSWWPPGRIGWDSSRVVIDVGSQQAETINEFPWFSLLLGDLHPHLTALPFAIMALALGGSLLTLGDDEPYDLLGWARLAVIGAAIGGLYPLNSLDFPTYLLIALVMLLVAGGFTRLTLKRLSVLAVSALVVWLPFTAKFVPFTGGDIAELPGPLQKIPLLRQVLTTLRIYSGERTSVSEFLTVFGAFWIIVVSLLALLAYLSIKRFGMPRIFWPVVIFVALLALAALAIPATVLILAGLPCLIAAWLAARAREQENLPMAAVLILISFAMLLLVGTELFYVQDSFDGRYNTVFKVYYQVWMILGIAAAVGLAALWKGTAASRIARAGLSIGIATLLVAAAAYPVAATLQWTEVNGPRDWLGLDGAVFMEEISPDDWVAIQWLNDNADQSDVVLEAPGCSYQVNGSQPTSGVASFTGIPDVIGWSGHEVQWRGGQPKLFNAISPRQADVAAMFADPQSNLFDVYGVDYIFVGTYERDGTASCDTAGPFPAVLEEGYPGEGWQEVFRSGDTAVLQRIAS